MKALAAVAVCLLSSCAQVRGELRGENAITLSPAPAYLDPSVAELEAEAKVMGDTFIFPVGEALFLAFEGVEGASQLEIVDVLPEAHWKGFHTAIQLEIRAEFQGQEIQGRGTCGTYMRMRTGIAKATRLAVEDLHAKVLMVLDGQQVPQLDPRPLRSVDSE